MLVRLANLTAPEQLCELQVGLALTPAFLAASQGGAAGAAASGSGGGGGGGGGLSAGAIVAIVVGCLVALPVVVFGFAYLRWRQRWLRQQQIAADADLEKASQQAHQQQQPSWPADWGIGSAPPGASFSGTLGVAGSAASAAAASAAVAAAAASASRLSSRTSGRLTASSQEGSAALAGGAAVASECDSQRSSGARGATKLLSEAQLLREFVRALVARQSAGSEREAVGSADSARASGYLTSFPSAATGSSAPVAARSDAAQLPDGFVDGGCAGGCGAGEAGRGRRLCGAPMLAVLNLFHYHLLPVTPVPSSPALPAPRSQL